MVRKLRSLFAAMALKTSLSVSVKFCIVVRRRHPWIGSALPSLHFSA
jgi:hypothetical protein